MPDPPLIGLTGGIAAGKSEALRILAELGAETLSTDAVVHELLAGEEVRDRLVAQWGPEVAPDGDLDREVIGERVFGKPEELQWLESVLHPLVGERVLEWRQELSGSEQLGVIEVPLLFEGEMAEMFDATIAVIADDAVREERAAARGTGGLEGRSARQLSQAEKAERATHVVVNDNSVEDLERALRELMPALEAAGR